ncbi:MAG: carboxypeptidase-like regulatory domain-containing protein [Planctomycetota bacterium]
MGSKNPLLLLALLVSLGLGVLFATLGRDSAAGGEDGALSAAAPPELDPDRPAADLLAPGPGPAGPAAEAVRTVVTPAAAKSGPAPAPAVAVGPRIRGRVLDRDGAGVAGARVLLAGPGFFPLDARPASFGERRFEAATDPEGRFSLDEGPPPGTLRVAVRAPGFAPYTRSGVPLPAGEEVLLEPFTVSRGAILSGVVVDPHGTGVAGAEILREAEGDGPWSFSGVRSPAATTGADGSFRIDELACGTWKLVVTSAEFPDRAFEGLAEAPGREYGGQVFRLLPGRTVSGLVTGVPEEERGKLQVRATRVRSESGFGFTRPEVRVADVDAAGAFVVRGLQPEAQVDLQARTRSEGSEDWWWGGGSARSEAVRAQAGAEGIELVYRPEAALVFQVRDARTRAPVTVFRVEAGVGWKRPLTDEDDRPRLRHPDGRVRVDGLRPAVGSERAELAIHATGYQDYEQGEIALAAGEELDLGTIFLEPVPVLAVTVRDAATRGPIEGARVELQEAPAPPEPGAQRVTVAMSTDWSADMDVDFPSGGVRRAETDAEGVARLNSLPGTLARLRVTAAGHALYQRDDLALPAEGDAAETVLLASGGEVVVSVVDPAGAPVPGVGVARRGPSVRAAGPVILGPGPRGREVTDTAGEVRFPHLETGSHSFRIRSPGGGIGGFLGENAVIEIAGLDPGAEEPGWASVEVVEGETARLTLVATPRATLAGRVREAGVPLAGATLRLSPRAAGESAARMAFLGIGGGPSARTDGDGRYEIENVEPGLYTLTVEHRLRHMPEELEARVKEGETRFDVELSVAILEGRVTDQEGEPLAGMRVTARRSQGDGNRVAIVRTMFVAGDGGDVFGASTGEALGDETRTDADGRYRLRGVVPDVELVVEAEGSDVETGRTEPLRVGPDQVRTGVDLQLAAAGRVRVAVASADGTPVQFAMVRAAWQGEAAEDPGPQHGFAQDGTAVLTGLRPGPWRVTVSPPGGEDSPRERAQAVLIVAREEARLAFTLD